MKDKIIKATNRRHRAAIQELIDHAVQQMNKDNFKNKLNYFYFIRDYKEKHKAITDIIETQASRTYAVYRLKTVVQNDSTNILMHIYDGKIVLNNTLNLTVTDFQNIKNYKGSKLDGVVLDEIPEEMYSNVIRPALVDKPESKLIKIK